MLPERFVCYRILQEYSKAHFITFNLSLVNSAGQASSSNSEVPRHNRPRYHLHPVGHTGLTSAAVKHNPTQPGNFKIRFAGAKAGPGFFTIS